MAIYSVYVAQQGSSYPLLYASQVIADEFSVLDDDALSFYVEGEQTAYFRPGSWSAVQKTSEMSVADSAIRSLISEEAGKWIQFHVKPRALR